MASPQWLRDQARREGVSVTTISDRAREQEMAKRDRFRNLVWMARLPTDIRDDKFRVIADMKRGVADCITILTHDQNLWIEMEQHGGEYILRCYPRPSSELLHVPRICASYRGARLSAVLNCAVYDYENHMDNPGATELSRLEVPRWVA
jgi:hypothetical protein